MTEPCSWQDKRGNDCARPAVWNVGNFGTVPERFFDYVGFRDDPVLVPACNVHLGDIVRERAVEWVGCWVDKA